jgi:hypothetical protein
MLDFLRARLGEEEATANAAGANGHDRWIAAWGTVVDAADPDSYAMITDSTSEVCAHIARHDPATALAEVKVWRRLLLEYSIPAGTDAVYGGTERETGFRLALGFALKCKYMTYSSHPEYRESLLSA